jgi:hypothetical protein
VFLGLSALTVTLIRAEGIPVHWVGWVRAALLALGVLWSTRLAWGMASGRGALRGLAAAGGVAVALSAAVWLWIEMFYLW